MDNFGRHIFLRRTIDMVEMGKKLREKRESRHLSVDAIARHLGVSPQAVYQWEAGKMISLRHLLGLCWLLKISTDELIKPKVEKGEYYDYEK